MILVILGIIAGIDIAIWRASVVKNFWELSRPGADLEKKKLAANCPFRAHVSQMICTIADFLVPAGPCNQHIFVSSPAAALIH